jgi:hypothetical protein
MMMMYVHLNFHGAKISDENKHPNFLLANLKTFSILKERILKFAQNCSYENHR